MLKSRHRCFEQNKLPSLQLRCLIFSQKKPVVNNLNTEQRRYVQSAVGMLPSHWGDAKEVQITTSHLEADYRVDCALSAYWPGFFSSLRRSKLQTTVICSIGNEANLQNGLWRPFCSVCLVIWVNLWKGRKPGKAITRRGWSWTFIRTMTVSFHGSPGNHLSRDPLPRGWNSRNTKAKLSWHRLFW